MMMMRTMFGEGGDFEIKALKVYLDKLNREDAGKGKEGGRERQCRRERESWT